MIKQTLRTNIYKSETLPDYVYMAIVVKVYIGKIFLDVDLKYHVYICKEWQMTVILCPYASTTIHYMGLEIVDFVDAWNKFLKQE